MRHEDTVRIAIPAYTPDAGRVISKAGGGFSVPEHYVHAVHRSGGVPYMLSAYDQRNAGEIVEDFSGVMLIGGGDVNASLYGRVQHEASYDREYDRDEFEMELVRASIRRGVPVLAICRGLQLVNVALGGTLTQHLPDQDLTVPHRSANGSTVFHEISTAPESLLAKICGHSLYGCSSRHHQGVDEVASALTPSGWAADGTIEALELNDSDGWFLAVQWHPEETAAQDATQQAIFDAFIAACQEYSPHLVGQT